MRHPLFWGGAATLALNDHLLKGAGIVPELVTGKLSDVAGLLVAPTLLAVLLGARSRIAVLLCHVAPLVGMALIKLSPAIAERVVAAAAAFGESWAIVADPSDLLVAFPAACASWWWLARPARAGADVLRPEAGRPAMRDVVLLVFAGIACCATSRTPPQAPAIDRGLVVAGPWAENETYVIERSGRALRKLDVASGDPPAALDGALWTIRAEEGRRAIVAHELDTGRQRVLPMPALRVTRVGAVDARAIYVETCVDAFCERAAWAAIDRATGRVLWTSPTSARSPIAVGGGMVATTHGRRLEMRDPSGALREARSYDADVRVLAVADALWVVDATGDVEALRTTDGTLLGRWNLGERGKALASGDRSRIDAAASGSRLFVASASVVVALEVGAPHTLWERKGDGVAVTGDTVVVDAGDVLHGVDARTGGLRWSAPGAWGRFAVGDGLVARRDGDTYVTILDARTGQQLSRFDLDEGERASD